MANTIITPALIAKEAMLQLENNMVMANNVHREYKQAFVKVGDTVSIRRPVKFSVTNGATMTKQDVEEAKDTIVISKRKHVGWGFASLDATLSIEEYSERYIKPAFIVLANQVDTDLCSLYNDVWNWVGRPGQTVNSFSDLSKAPQRLDEMSVPTDRRKGVLAPADTWAMAGSQAALYMQDKAKEAYTSGPAWRDRQSGAVPGPERPGAHHGDVHHRLDAAGERGKPEHDLCVVRRHQHPVADHRRLGDLDAGSAGRRCVHDCQCECGEPGLESGYGLSAAVRCGW